MSITKTEYITYPNYEWIVNFNDTTDWRLSPPADNITTIAQAVKLILSTERYIYPIMPTEVGVQLQNLIGTDYNYVKGEIKTRITEALSIDDRITSVDNFIYNNTDDGLYVTFNVHTILGDVPAEITI